MRYFLEIAYNGTNYSGWQVQPRVNTVQLEINKALSTVLSQEIKCTGCGRTDAGVHAKQFYLHFDTDKMITGKTLFKLNQLLTKSIAARQFHEVANDAHSRFDAVERTYQYFIHFNKNPFLQDLSYYWTYPKPNVDLMNQAASLLLNYEDFKILSKTDRQAKSSNCKVVYSKWENEKDRLRYTITADRFLRGMVRLITGMQLMIGTERITLKEMKHHLDSRKRFKYILPVPACALYLVSVKYPFIK